MAKRSGGSKTRKAKAPEKKTTTKGPVPPPKAAPGRRFQARHALRFGVIFVIVCAVLLWLVNRPPPDGQVWSAEHGHWHDANGGELSALPVVIPEAAPGQVWSEEHGHWHDPDGNAVE